MRKNNCLNIYKKLIIFLLKHLKQSRTKSNLTLNYDLNLNRIISN